MSEAIRIKYVGRRPFYREGCYGSSLEFAKGESRLVHRDLAVKLLRHPDVYVMDEAQPGGGSSSQDVADVEVAGTPKPPEQVENTLTDEALLHVSTLPDNESLEQYSMQQWNLKLDKRKSIDSNRAEVEARISMYGVHK